MKNFNEYFEKQGSLYLNNVTYKLITLDTNPNNVKRKVIDKLDSTFINNNTQLQVVFTREIKHEPEELFNLVVSFGAVYTFKKECLDYDFDKIDFDDMLKNNKNRLFLNIISRTSQLISEITSSHGQNPFVTPPLFLNNDDEEK
ncbi:MAG: hypothetical protein K9L64_04695 [Candidatus Izimaplasma sp.]|nr:hypothetical protein [Candidatus Izimaplasma bacterium]